MRPLGTITCCMLMSICAQSTYAQQGSVQKKQDIKNIKFVETDSGVVINEYVTNGCKNYECNSFLFRENEKGEKGVVKNEEPPRAKLLTIHGNISYDFVYRSKIDTPFNQQDFQQHTERVMLEITVKDKYPLRLNLASRQSNSPFFRNFLDANFQFDKYAYNKNLKQQLINKLNTQLPEMPEMTALKAALDEQQSKLAQLKNYLNDPGVLQKIMEERERKYYDSIRKVNWKNDTQVYLDSLEDKTGKDRFAKNITGAKAKADTVTERLTNIYKKNKASVDTVTEKIAALQKRLDSLKYQTSKNIAAIRQKIYAAGNEKELRKIAAENGLATDARDRFAEKLAAIKTFSVGRTMLDYTELTAQNILITGVNVEYNPSYYVAFSAGKIDYRFRDFYNKKSKSNGQYLVMGRLGIGDKDKKAVIFSLFQGRKSQSDFALSDSVTNYVNIIGYSVETIIKKNENTFLSAEFAKSTKPLTGNLRDNKAIDALTKFSDESNMGINIKGQTFIPQTNTRLSGFFRKTGGNFQSFSLFSYNTDQTAWLARADQQLYKNKVGVSAMLRQNDFTNPFTEKTYKTTTVFKSFLLNVRFPKYPALSIGYYPGTQLYFIDKERIRENAYYIVNGTLSYSYSHHKIGMNSSLIYNRYISQASDSGFFSYRGANYFASQSFFLKDLQLQGGYSYNKQPELEYYTLETSADYSLRKWLRIGGGAKYNDISNGSNYWGKRMQLSIDVRSLGSFQFQYEKSFLPTINKTLYPVETGRVSWYKYF